jgi:hypothetical protein
MILNAVLMKKIVCSRNNDLVRFHCHDNKGSTHFRNVGLLNETVRRYIRRFSTSVMMSIASVYRLLTLSNDTLKFNFFSHPKGSYTSTNIVVKQRLQTSIVRVSSVFVSSLQTNIPCLLFPVGNGKQDSVSEAVDVFLNTSSDFLEVSPRQARIMWTRGENTWILILCGQSFAAAFKNWAMSFWQHFWIQFHLTLWNLLKHDIRTSFILR